MNLRHNNFDFLRIFFAFIVVIGHLIIISGVDDFIKILPYFNTYISVTAFFIISGFLITSSYLRTNSIKLYLKKRAQRILPAYIFVILISGLFLSFFSQYSFSEYFSNYGLYRYLAANLTFLNFIEPCLPGVFVGNNYNCVVNGALWTLKIEVCFYLVIPILISITQRINKKYIFFIAIYCTSILYKNLLEHLSVQHEVALYAILGRQLPGFLSYFISGIACYYYYDYFIQHKNKLLILGLFLFTMERIIDWEIFTPFALSLIVFTIAFSIKKLNNFGKFGDISYGIYIFHFPIMQLAVYFGFFEPQYNPYLISFFIIIIVLLTGFLSWHFIEKPFLNRNTLTKAYPALK